MYACPKCGRLTCGDYLLWKGGINQAHCKNCREEEEKERKDPAGDKK